MNRKARPGHATRAPRDYVAANFASRTMRWTGVLVLLFLFFHLGDLTWGWFNPGFTRGDAYHNVDASLSRWWMNLFYIVANLALVLHLFHGGWSLFQSLGWNNPRFNQAGGAGSRWASPASWSSATSRSPRCPHRGDQRLRRR